MSYAKAESEAREQQRKAIADCGVQPTPYSPTPLSTAGSEAPRILGIVGDLRIRQRQLQTQRQKNEDALRLITDLLALFEGA